MKNRHKGQPTSESTAVQDVDQPTSGIASDASQDSRKTGAEDADREIREVNAERGSDEPIDPSDLEDFQTPEDEEANEEVEVEASADTDTGASANEVDEKDDQDQEEGQDEPQQAEVTLTGLSEKLNALEEKLEAAKSKTSGTGRTKSGSKPRPNVVYHLASKPPAWAGTPQVAQLEKILFTNTLDDGKFKQHITEPELFDLIVKGKEQGMLRTNQEPVRIFQYYRSDLIKSNVLRMTHDETPQPQK